MTKHKGLEHGNHSEVNVNDFVNDTRSDEHSSKWLAIVEIKVHPQI